MRDRSHKRLGSEDWTQRLRPDIAFEADLHLNVPGKNAQVWKRKPQMCLVFLGVIIEGVSITKTKNGLALLRWFQSESSAATG